jgi:hypothetical protein
MKAPPADILKKPTISRAMNIQIQMGSFMAVVKFA